jgi:hypothetical protein
MFSLQFEYSIIACAAASVAAALEVSDARGTVLLTSDISVMFD